jgi:hypothetical protein
MTPEQRRVLSNVLRKRMRRLSADLVVLRTMLMDAARCDACQAEQIKSFENVIAEWLHVSKDFEADIARLETGEVDAAQVERLRRVASLN